MDFFESVGNFFGSIESSIGKVGDWLFGTDSGLSDLPDELAYTQGMSGSSPIQTAIDYGTGFFGSDSALKTGAKLAGAYLSGTGDEKKRKPKDFLIKIGEGPGTPAAARSATPRFVGENNQSLRNAVNRLASRTNLNPQTADIARTYLTVQQGRRTLGTPSPTMARVTPTAAASVRTASKEVDIA